MELNLLTHIIARFFVQSGFFFGRSFFVRVYVHCLLMFWGEEDLELLVFIVLLVCQQFFSNMVS